MKKLIFLSIVFFFVQKLHTQDLFENFYGGCAGEISKDAIICDNNIFVVGASGSYYWDKFATVIYKNDLNGVNTWAKALKLYSTGYSGGITNIVKFDNNNFLIQGGYESNGGGISDDNQFLLMIDSSGNHKWSKLFYEVEIRKVIKDSNNDFVLCGRYKPQMGYKDFPFIMKLDSAGNLLNSKYLYPDPNLPNFESGHASDIISYNDSTYILTGRRYFFDFKLAGKNYFPYYPFIVKLDNDFNTLWSQYINMPKLYSHFTVLSPENSKSIYLTGKTDSDTYPIDVPYIIKLNSNGAINWIKTYEYQYDEHRMLMIDSDLKITLTETNNNKLLLSSTVEEYNNTGGDSTKYLLTKLDTTGNLLWSKIIGNNHNHNVLQTTVHTGNYNYVIGTTNSNELNYSGPPFLKQNDIHLFSVDNNGNTILNSYDIPLEVYLKNWSSDTLHLNAIYALVIMVDSNFILEPVNPYFDSLDCVIIGIDDQVAFSKKSILNVFPNPCSGTMNIEYSENIKTLVDVKLYNFYGNEVFKQIINPINDNFIVDISHLPNGIYLIETIINNRLYITKVIKQK